MKDATKEKTCLRCYSKYRSRKEGCLCETCLKKVTSRILKPEPYNGNQRLFGLRYTTLSQLLTWENPRPAGANASKRSQARQINFKTTPPPHHHWSARNCCNSRARRLTGSPTTLW